MPSDKDGLVGITLASGLQNVVYGVWRSRCCGDQIVLYSGAVFPICNKHPGGVTEWVLITTDLLRKTGAAEVARRHSQLNVISSTLHLTPDRLKKLSRGGVVSEQIECAHLVTCQECQSTLRTFAHEYHQRRNKSRTRKSA